MCDDDNQCQSGLECKTEHVPSPAPYGYGINPPATRQVCRKGTILFSFLAAYSLTYTIRRDGLRVSGCRVIDPIEGRVIPYEHIFFYFLNGTVCLYKVIHKKRSKENIQ